MSPWARQHACWVSVVLWMDIVSDVESDNPCKDGTRESGRWLPWHALLSFTLTRYNVSSQVIAFFFLGECDRLSSSVPGPFHRVSLISCSSRRLMGGGGVRETRFYTSPHMASAVRPAGFT